MTYLEVVYNGRKTGLTRKEFSLQQCRKAFKFFWNHSDSQIVLRGTKLGVFGCEPKFHEYSINENTVYWSEKDYLRKFAEWMRQNKDVINWDNKPEKDVYVIFYFTVNEKGFPEKGWFVRDCNGEIKTFPNEEEAKQYADKYLKGFHIKIDKTITW
ncbi:MAG: hypothetical protein QXJ31_05175 [Candidatus Bathyarchaeia archaeon]